MERYQGWAAYNATCEPGREWRPGMPELTDLACGDQVQDAEDRSPNSPEYNVLFLPGGGSSPDDQPGNLIGWCKVLDSVVVLRRGVTLQAAQKAMMLPTPRLGTLQAIASSLEPKGLPTLPSSNGPASSS